MEYCKIDGINYPVNITEITETFNILYSDATGRTIDTGARMTLSPLGTFYGHRVTFKRKSGYEEEYDRLFDYLSLPKFDGIPIEMVHGQTTISYEAYVSSGERAIKRIDEKNGKVYWDALSVNFIPIEAQVKPYD